MIITILTDNKSSWFISYGNKLKKQLTAKGHEVKYIFDKVDIPNGDVCFLLSCTKIVQQEFLDKNKHNIVIHASDLPQGKGFSPLQWQILEGKDTIVLTLFEAVDAVDAGSYYMKRSIEFDGSEMHDELRHILAEKIIEMSLEFIDKYSEMQPIEQFGQDSFYPRRTEKDDEINPEKSIVELFNHFRIANNEQFPLYFNHRGHKYTIKIEKHLD